MSQTLGPMTPGGEVELPAWVNGTASHTWSPRLGGGLWYPQLAVVEAVAPVLVSEMPRPPLVGLRGGRHETGYRFDLNSWDSSTNEYSWWEDRASAETILQTFLDEGPTDFIWSMPMPKTLSATPIADENPSGGGPGFRWQKASYYAAYLQYLIGAISMSESEYNALNSTYDFFTDATCANVNTTSESAVGNNWANLRAKRGHPDPYTLVAVILGVEPYGDAQEYYEADGDSYGTMLESFRVAIRARGGNCATVPLGLSCLGGLGSMSDFDESRTWVKPMFDAIGETGMADLSYFDLHHHYALGGGDFARIYPAAVNVDTSDTSPGWQEFWLAQSTWKSDFTKYLYIYEDAKVALDQWGETSSRWKFGCAEHGLAITSAFSYNDFGAGIHWALWLAELMRYNAHWDENWVLAEQGFAHAQIHYRDSHVTRTPGFYVYQMAASFYGFEYLPTHTEGSYHVQTPTYTSPTAQTGTTSGGQDWSSADVVVRVLRDSTNGHVHLFVINKHPSNTADITGFEAATLVGWDRLSAASLTKDNPVGNHAWGGSPPVDACHSEGTAWHSETIYTTEVSGSHTPGNAFTIQPLSINHIEVS